MPLKLPRFERTVPLVDEQGKATQVFHIWWQKVVENLEIAFNDLEAIVLDLEEIVLDIQAAQAAAEAAQLDALAAARETARVNSYTLPTSLLTAADAGADASITIIDHTRVYPVQGTVDVPDATITGATISGLAFNTQYWVYYDDTTLSNTTPTYVATEEINDAQVGAAAGRHFVGTITTPADGGTSTEGTGGSPPGGGGGVLKPWSDDTIE